MHKLSLRLLLVLSLILVPCIHVFSQVQSDTDVKDYSKTPYWIDMMQDPDGNFFEVQKAFYAYWKDRDVTRGSGYNPFKRWEYYWQSRINPDGTFPEPDYLSREYNNYIQSHPVSGRLKTGQAVWKELGPRSRVNAGVGRLNAIACHPSDTSIIYVGAPSGGVWKTTDGGTTWAVLTDSLPTLGVSSILIHPSKTDDILVGTGDRDHSDAPGLGVIHSPDGGITWESYNTGMGNVTVGMMARSETNPDVILAATSGGIYKTIDGGAHWALKYSVGNWFKDIQLKPGNSNVAYATSVGAVGFHRSEDAGETWTKIQAGGGVPAVGRMVIGVTPAASNYVYLVCGETNYVGCFLSQDDGKNFVLQSSSPNILGWSNDGSGSGSQAWYDLSIFVNPSNRLEVYVGGINLWRSDDGGKTWNYIMSRAGSSTSNVHVDQHTFFHNPLNNRLYAGNDGGIYYTDNRGTSWTEISSGLGIGQIYKLGVSNTDPIKTLSGFQDNGSATWTGTGWVNATGGDGMECAVDPRDARYSYSTSQNGPLYRNINNNYNRYIGGKDVNGITEEGAWVTPFLISERDEKTIVIGYKNIWICKDVKTTGTITWTRISNNLANRNDVNMSSLEHSPVNQDLLFAVRSDGKLFRTDNLMGITVAWTDLTSKLPVSGTPSDVECHPYDQNVVFISTNRKIYKSADKGENWENISGTLPNISINTIVFDKASNEGLYVGTDAGIFYRDAEMADWVLYGTALPVSVGTSELEIYNDQRDRNVSRLRASTFGRGVWEIPLAPSSGLLVPYVLTATVVDKTVELAWAPPYYQQDILEYRIYRNGELIGSINGTSLTDHAPTPDIQYTYEVAALYTGNRLSGFSNAATVTIVSPIELPYTQAFENGPAGWNAKLTKYGWKYGDSEQLEVTGREGKFFAASSATAGAGVSVTDYLTTPTIDLSSYAGKTITLKFAYTMRLYRTFDKFSIHFRAAPDSAWVKLKDMKAPSKTAWVWDTTEINLPERALTPAMQLGFYYTNSNEFAWGAAVDDVSLFVNATSTQIIDNLSSISLYPNPGTGLFRLDMNLARPGDVTIRVVTLTGQELLSRKIENAAGRISESFDLTHQGKGMYFILVNSAAGGWKQKVIIQ
jgi:photosystem II stability/assembly factor-like uncharacterized protein